MGGNRYILARMSAAHRQRRLRNGAANVPSMTSILPLDKLRFSRTNPAHLRTSLSSDFGGKHFDGCAAAQRRGVDWSSDRRMFPRRPSSVMVGPGSDALCPTAPVNQKRRLALRRHKADTQPVDAKPAQTPSPLDDLLRRACLQSQTNRTRPSSLPQRQVFPRSQPSNSDGWRRIGSLRADEGRGGGRRRCRSAPAPYPGRGRLQGAVINQPAPST
jgi:hypothetical protein